MRDMPIMSESKPPVDEVRVHRVPWVLFAGTDEWCQKHHGQSLEMIALRGGFDAREALRVACNLTHFPEQLSYDDAHRILYALAVMYRRGQRSIVEGTDALPSSDLQNQTKST